MQERASLSDLNILRTQINSLANDEQKIAIFSDGDVILSAGAGSGKTYVLVRHLLIKVEDIIVINSSLPPSEIIYLIRKYFSETVLMTFTKKAAAEIQIRIKKTILELIENNLSDDASKRIWSEVLDIVDELNVTTIDGFCHRLVSKGLIPQIKSDFEISEDWQAKKKIENILSSWVDLNINQENLKKTVFDSHLHLGVAVSVLTSIFSDPLLHFEWFNRLQEDLVLDQKCYDKIFEKFLEVMEIDKLREALSLAVNDYEFLPVGKKPLAWISHFNIFKILIDKNDISFLHFFDSWEEAFNNVSRLTIPKNNGEHIRDFFLRIKDFREIFKMISGSFLNFRTDLEIQNYWLKLHRDMFKYCESEYYKDDQLTFSDLEYMVCRSVQDEKTSKALSNYFKYFIIDEFQDTSEIQFLIVSQIIQNQSSKLFVVGDVKQAIYGFRGGELEVFKRTSSLLSHRLSLVTNYRSEKSIVKFNNQLFSFLFGLDHSGPLYFDQKVPGKRDSNGHIQKNIIKISKIENIKDLTVEQVESFEAIGILKWIKEITQHGDVTVLYRKLRPSIKLIKLLMKENISFSAQVKIALKERPLYGILNYYLKYLLVRESDGASEKQDLVSEFVVYIGIYSELISGKKIDCSLEEKVKNSYQNFKIIGAFESFRILLLEIGIFSINLPSELSEIKKYFYNFNNDLRVIITFLDSRVNELENIQFSWGKSSPKVKIMTVHASKGLEFKNVILGGINTNGPRSKSVDDLGVDIFSFKYKKGNERIKRKTPWYHYEKIIAEKKELAESVRLFYVACTRAISSLYWFSVVDDRNEIFNNPYSWNNYLEKFCNNSAISAQIEIENYSIDKPSVERPSPDVPLIYFSDLGYRFQTPFEISHIGLISEISVTKFSLLDECPHKFYLSNILKIEEMSLSEEEVPKDFPFDFEIIGTKTSSNAQRGSAIHLEISNYFKFRNELPLKKILPKQKFEWFLEEVRKIEKRYHALNIFFKTEVEFKFSLFSQMVSAIPDLIIQDFESGEVLEIIDFKTGKDREFSREKYWTQLFSYAYGQFKLKKINIQKSITLRLIYLDEMKTETRSHNQYEINTRLYQSWKKLSKLNEHDRSACSLCKFKNICLHCTDSSV